MDMKERYKKDFLSTINIVEDVYKWVLKEMPEPAYNVNVKFTCQNDKVINEFKKICGVDRLGSYLCLKLCAFDGVDYFTAYFYVLCVRSCYNYYLSGVDTFGMYYPDSSQFFVYPFFTTALNEFKCRATAPYSYKKP